MELVESYYLDKLVCQTPLNYRFKHSASPTSYNKKIICFDPMLHVGVFFSRLCWPSSLKDQHYEIYENDDEESGSNEDTNECNHCGLIIVFYIVGGWELLKNRREDLHIMISSHGGIKSHSGKNWSHGVHTAPLCHCD
jgi:hypothetical protein